MVSLCTPSLGLGVYLGSAWFVFVCEKVKNGKDVDLYSASHVQDTSNAHFVTETEPAGRF